jgi:hypothetical protein
MLGLSYLGQHRRRWLALAKQTLEFDIPLLPDRISSNVDVVLQVVNTMNDRSVRELSPENDLPV